MLEGWIDKLIEAVKSGNEESIKAARQALIDQNEELCRQANEDGWRSAMLEA